MFRLKNNVPETYVNGSRDFQLMCNIYDSVFNGVKYSVDSLSHTNNTMECSNSLLELLANKLGFFTNLNLPDNEIRYLLEALPYIYRYKGSERALDYAIVTFQRMSKMNNVEYAKYIDNEARTLFILFGEEISNAELLNEIISYVLPTGYLFAFSSLENSTKVTRISVKNTVSYEVIGQADIDAGVTLIDNEIVYADTETFPENANRIKKKYLGSVETAIVSTTPTIEDNTTREDVEK